MPKIGWQSDLHGKINLNIVYSHSFVNTFYMVPGSIRVKITQSGLKSYTSQNKNSLSTGTQSSRSSSSVRSWGVVDDDLVGWR